MSAVAKNQSRSLAQRHAATAMVAIFLVIVFYGLLYDYWKAVRRIELERTGIIGNGTVEYLQSSESRGRHYYYVTFSFSAATTHGPISLQQTRGNITARDFASLHVGDAARVLYEPAHPDVSELQLTMLDMPKPWAQLKAAFVWALMKVSVVALLLLPAIRKARAQWR